MDEKKRAPVENGLRRQRPRTSRAPMTKGDFFKFRVLAARAPKKIATASSATDNRICPRRRDSIFERGLVVTPFDCWSVPNARSPKPPKSMAVWAGSLIMWVLISAKVHQASLLDSEGSRWPKSIAGGMAAFSSAFRFRCPFFGYFLWTSKESNNTPRGHINGGVLKKTCFICQHVPL